ncbi:MAG: DUF1738 domain-containing protein [Proteobacteria bacterium]|nr:DUF1738 domain-containing protein [Chloroflexota bacterium]MYJ95824.1 DUF1738 domain-containing protein [Pseudomonadota bacterium]
MDPKPVTDEEILQSIIEQMERGVSPWRKPWADSAAGVIIGSLIHDRATWPSNLRAPKTPYGVFNGTILLGRASDRGYRTNLWITSEVVESLDVKTVDDDDRPTAIQRYREYEPYRGSYEGVRLVYNIDQICECERSLGLAFLDKQPTNTSQFRFERSEALLDRLKQEHSLQIVRENRAAYAPSWDVVMMPDLEQFYARVTTGSQARKAEANYWATMWHEVVHWTGHHSRLDRLREARWGDSIYAFEELVAELGAAFICAFLGVNGELQHESYLDSWCQALKRDKVKALWEASRHAAAAKDFILAKGKSEANSDQPLFG